MSAIYLVCPVRNCDHATKLKMDIYVANLESAGHEVHYPPRDVDQSKMIAVMVTLQAKPGDEELVEKQMKWFASECINKEPGTLLYTIIKSEQGVHTMGIYKDEAAFKAPIEAQYETQGHPYYASARMWDDGVIDPTDTRRILGLSLATVTGSFQPEPEGYGIFRM